MSKPTIACRHKSSNKFLHAASLSSLLLIAPLVSVAREASAAGTGVQPATVSATVQAAADAAFQYGYPLTETMRVCDSFPFTNSMFGNTALATPLNNVVVRTNNDTLYTAACVYLGASWVLLNMPAAKGKYLSLQLFDAYTKTALAIGPREVPATGGQFVLHLRGSGESDLPAGVPVIEVDTPYALLIGRALPNGAADLAATVALLDGVSLTPNSTFAPERRYYWPFSDSRDFFQTLMYRLAQNPPPGDEQKHIAAFIAAGVRPLLAAFESTPTAEHGAAWESAYTRGMAQLAAEFEHLGERRGSWVIADPNIAAPGSDFALRATVARLFLFALPPSQAMYAFTETDKTGAALDGRSSHTLQLPPAWPPIDPRGFWSLTVYGPDGFMVNNAIERYSISKRTPGVKFEADGSLKLFIQCKDPGGVRSANWLPAPCGPFNLVMRLYLPEAAALDPGFTSPALQ